MVSFRYSLVDCGRKMKNYNNKQAIMFIYVYTHTGIIMIHEYNVVYVLYLQYQKRTIY